MLLSLFGPLTTPVAQARPWFISYLGSHEPPLTFVARLADSCGSASIALVRKGALPSAIIPTSRIFKV